MVSKEIKIVLKKLNPISLKTTISDGKRLTNSMFFDMKFRKEVYGNFSDSSWCSKHFKISQKLTNQFHGDGKFSVPIIFCLC